MTAGDPPAHGDPPTHWFQPVADHLGAAYLRYSFTKGTVQEVDFLVATLGLVPGRHRVLDVGCGPGRHSHELARRGIEVVGIDVSRRFVDLATAAAPPGATFVHADARDLEIDAEFDAVLSLCQGAFGLVSGPTDAAGDEPRVLAGMARALRPGGRLALSAFSAYFQVRWLEAERGNTFDAARGVHHEVTTIKDAEGREVAADLWTTCYTPRELTLLAERAGLAVEAVYSVEPGNYAARPPDLDHAEFLLLARR